jgi:hypothetical protein
MPEGHPGVEHAESLNEAMAEAKEMEAPQKLALSEDDITRVVRGMGAEEFFNFLESRGLDPAEPIQLDLAGREIKESFNDVVALQEFIKTSVLN